MQLEGLKISRNALDDPEVVERLDAPLYSAAILEELVGRFVKDSRRVLALSEVRAVLTVEVDACPPIRGCCRARAALYSSRVW